MPVVGIIAKMNDTSIEINGDFVVRVVSTFDSIEIEKPAVADQGYDFTALSDAFVVGGVNIFQIINNDIIAISTDKIISADTQIYFKGDIGMRQQITIKLSEKLK